MAVEGDVRIGEVVHQDELTFAGQVDERLHQLGRRDGRGRVVREGDDHDARLRQLGADGLLDRGQEVGALEAAGVHDGRTGKTRSDEMDRVGGRRNDARVAGLEQHPHEVGETLLGADGRDDMALRIKGHTEMAFVPLADGLAQIRETAARGVAMVDRFERGLGELFDGNSGRRNVRVAEPKVDDVAALTAQFSLQVVDRCEDVRGQIMNPTEFHSRPQSKETRYVS